jgi:hypothetical protein
LFLRSKIPNNSVCGAKRHRNLIKRTKRKRLFRSYSLYSFEGTEGSGNSKKRIQASILEKHSFRFIKNLNKVSGGNNGEETPVPIPNTEVKLSSADDTWVETPWESRSLPDFYSSIAQSVEHAAVNRRVVGSSPTWGAREIFLYLPFSIFKGYCSHPDSVIKQDRYCAIAETRTSFRQSFLPLHNIFYLNL